LIWTGFAFRQLRGAAQSRPPLYLATRLTAAAANQLGAGQSEAGGSGSAGPESKAAPIALCDNKVAACGGGYAKPDPASRLPTR